MNVEIMTENAGTCYFPVVVGDVQISQKRKNTPTTLTFSVIKTPNLNIQKGNPCTVKIDNFKMFYGFVFKSNRNKDGTIKYTVYDQLRYFKNKDTYVYENQTATEVIQMLANDFNLQCGEIEDTKMKIESRVEDNKTLFDIVETALDLTLTATRELYVLYDDFGKLTLKNIANMKRSILIDIDTAEDYDYTSSIDGETYNKIKLVYENEETGKREVYIAQSGNNINKWGVLQYYEKSDNPINLSAKADSLLALYDKETRNLSIKNALGDVNIRAGCLIPIMLNLGDIVQNSFLMVESITHNFSQGVHLMDLTLIGGEFIA